MTEIEIDELTQYRQDMTEQQRMVFSYHYDRVKRNRISALLLSIFLGGVGADRFYVGDTGLGFLKLITAAGLGIWGIVDWFIIQRRADQVNRQIAHDLAEGIRNANAEEITELLELQNQKIESNKRRNKTVYKVLRALFVAGNAVSLVLVFVPSVRLGSGRGARLLSGFDVMNLLAQTGNLPWFLFILLLFVVAPILSIVLAIAHPKRWVFIGGSSVVAFALLITFFQGSNPNVHPVEDVQMFGYAISLLQMVGFVTKPPPPPTA